MQKARKQSLITFLVICFSGMMLSSFNTFSGKYGVGFKPADQTTRNHFLQTDSFTTIKVSFGTARRYFFHSNLVDSRYIEVWLPDGYTTTKKYSVLYMHDGQGLFDSTTTWNHQEWQVDETLGKLLKAGRLQNTIVVGIDNNGARREAEFFPEKPVANIPEPQRSRLLQLMPTGPVADRYLQFIVSELKPSIDRQYATYPDARHTFMGGSSLGGMVTLYALCEYPLVFSGGFCMSTHWIGTFEQNKQIPLAVIDYLELHLPPPNSHKFYFDHGTQGLDSLYAPAQQRVDSLMKAKGYTAAYFKSKIIAGATHQERDWAKRLDEPLLFLLGR